MTPKQIIALGAFSMGLGGMLLGLIWGLPAMVFGVIIAFGAAAICIGSQELHR